MSGFLTDPTVEAFFDRQQVIQTRRLAQLRRMVTPEMVAHTAELADNWPNLPAPVVAAAGVATHGVLPADSPTFASLSESEIRSRQREQLKAELGFGGTNPLNAAVRGAMTVFDALWNEGVARPFKTILGTIGATDQPAMLPWDAWKLAGASYGSEALARVFRDPLGNLTPMATRDPRNEVNLGRGLLPRSDPNAPGVNLTELGHRQTHEGLTRGGRPISPGRFLADFTPLEPGTGPYNILSGLADAGVQLVADPATALLRLAGAASRASRVFSNVSDVVSPVGRLARRQMPYWTRGAAGLVYRNARKWVKAPTAEGFLASEEGLRLTRVLDEMELDDLVDMFQHRSTGLDRAMFARIKGLDGPKERAADVLLEYIRAGKIRETPTPGAVSSRVGGVLAGDTGRVLGAGNTLRRWASEVSPGFDRTFRQMIGHELDIANLDRGFFQFNNFLHNAAIPKERRAGYLARWASAKPVSDRAEIFELVKDVYDDMADGILEKWKLEGVTPQARDLVREELDEIRNVFKSYRDIRQYFINEAGRSALFPGSRGQMLDDGSMLIEPTAQLMSEYLTRAIPLPDARMLRNALSPTRRKLVENLPDWAFKGPGGKRHPLGRGLAPYLIDGPMQAFWKPVTLLRIAWPIRVLGDELMRMTVEGFDTILSSPKSAIAWMIHDADGQTIQNVVRRLVDRAGIKPSGELGVLESLEVIGKKVSPEDIRLALSDEFKRIKTTRDPDALRGLWGNDRFARHWRSYRRGDAAYPTAMAHEVLQLTNDPLAAMAARTSVEETVAWLKSDEGLEFRKVMVAEGRLPDGAMTPNAEAWMNDDYLRFAVESAFARAHIKAGGRAVLEFNDNPGAATEALRQYARQRAGGAMPAAPGPQGWRVIDETLIPPDVVDAMGFRTGTSGQSQPWHRLRYRIDRPGDERVITAIGQGQLEFKGRTIGIRDTADATQRKEAFDALEELFRKGDWQGVGPENAKGPVLSKGGKEDEGFVNFMFRNLMGRPTDFVSRNPTARQLYWRRAEELLSYTDDLGRQRIYEAAQEANLPEPHLARLRTKVEQLRGTKGPMAAYRRVVDPTPTWPGGPRLAHGSAGAVPTEFARGAGGRPSGQLVGGELYSTWDPTALTYGWYGAFGDKALETNVLSMEADELGRILFNPGSKDPAMRAVSEPLVAGRPLPAVRGSGRVKAEEALEGAAEQTVRLEWTGDRAPVLLDLEEALPDEVARTMADRIMDYFGDDPEVRGELAGFFDSGPTGYDTMRLVFTRGSISDNPTLGALTAEQADEMYEILHDTLREFGYDGMTHTGGRITGGPSHKVHVWLTPENLKPRPLVSPAEVDEFLYTVDDLAKAYALSGVEDLLYDLNRRSNFMDIFRNLFPFGEAFKEIVTTWGRLVKDNPVVIRRAQQGIEAARGSGFFTTDPESGEEMFNYPGGGLMARMLFGAAANVGLTPEGGIAPPVGIQLQGRVQGLNLIGGSVLPGFGPVAQIAVSRLPRDPAFDNVKRLVNPYGSFTTAQSPGDVFDAFLPSWMRQTFTGIMGGNPNQERVKHNTAIDIYKALVLGGADVSTPERQNMVVRRAYALATRFTLIKGLATFAAPAALNAKFYVIPPEGREKMGEEIASELEGNVWFFQTLGAEYRRLLDKYQGDDVRAFDEFQAAYGLDPLLFATPKSETIERRPVDVEGDRWARDHPYLFEVAPHTAYYAHPDDETDTEFSYDAYLRQLQDGLRVPLSPEQWAAKHQDLLGRIRYERARQVADQVMGEADTERKLTALRAFRLFLMDVHPGYRQPNPGAPQKADLAMKIRELEQVWPNHEELAGTPVGVAVAKYLEARRQVAAVAERRGVVGWQTADRTRDLREALRRYASGLMNRYDGFDNLWQLILAHELDDDLPLTGAA